MSGNRMSRNAPCPCGSGKKYKNCCYRKDRGSSEMQFPIGTIALYGPDDKVTRRRTSRTVHHQAAREAGRSPLAAAFAV